MLKSFAGLELKQTEDVDGIATRLTTFAAIQSKLSAAEAELVALRRRQDEIQAAQRQGHDEIEALGRRRQEEMKALERQRQDEIQAIQVEIQRQRKDEIQTIQAEIARLTVAAERPETAPVPPPLPPPPAPDYGPDIAALLVDIRRQAEELRVLSEKITSLQLVVKETKTSVDIQGANDTFFIFLVSET